jgi:bifunctional DNA-binding transcriptional regulator/antitoxin component of YhaV-PrlF toxin-antitoxin module
MFFHRFRERLEGIMKETVVTHKGKTTIPIKIRRALGIVPGTVLEWSTQGNVIVVRKKTGVLNEVQKHIRSRAGTWKRKLSGMGLLRRTRP